MNSIPWFVWKEIISYAGYLNSDLHLVNKGWFKYVIRGDRFNKLDTYKISYNDAPSLRYKFAKTLNFKTLAGINWGFLNTCEFLTTIELSVLDGSEENFSQLVSFLSKTDFKTIKLKVSDNTRPERVLEVLNKISKSLNSIEIDSKVSDMTIDKILLLKYPYLSNLTVWKEKGLFDFSMIHQCMPNIKYTKLSSDEFISKPLFSKNILFSTLRYLEIYGCEEKYYDASKYLLGLFQINFLNLVSCKLCLLINYKQFQTISRNVPKLKVLEVQLLFTESMDLVFPIHLEKLCISSTNSLEAEGSVKLDLTKLPQLRKLEIEPGIKLVTSDGIQISVIIYLHFNCNFSLPEPFPCDQLSGLNTVELNCSNLNPNFCKVLQLSKSVPRLILYNSRILIPTGFLPGPFKTKHLELRGWKFLNNTFIKWLTQQFELTNLIIDYSSDLSYKLVPVIFPKLQEFACFCNSNQDEAYLKSVITGPLIRD